MTTDPALAADDAQDPRLARLPAFQSGGYVQKTGIALVHEGEYILPAPGSEAQLANAGMPGGQTVHYYFPIEVEVIGNLNQAQLARIASFVYDEIRDALPT